MVDSIELEEQAKSVETGKREVKPSLIEELPKIVERGEKEAQKLLDGLSKSQRIILQTNELVLPTKAKGGLATFTGQVVKEAKVKELLNRLIYGIMDLYHFLEFQLLCCVCSKSLVLKP